MGKQRKAVRIGVLVIAVSVLPAVAQVSDRKSICEQIVGILTADFRYGVPTSQLARVEIRQCGREEGATIQLVAWRSGSPDPVLLIDTNDFGVVQSFVRANLFIVETGGATRDQVFVIQYQRGEPKLAVKTTTKGTAEIRASEQAVDLVVVGIYAGEAAPRSESHHFSLDVDGTNPR